MSNSLQSRSRALLLEWLSLALRAVDGRTRVSAALAAPDIAAMIGGHRGVVVLAAGKAASRITTNITPSHMTMTAAKKTRAKR